MKKESKGVYVRMPEVRCKVPVVADGCEINGIIEEKYCNFFVPPVFVEKKDMYYKGFWDGILFFLDKYFK